MRSFPGIVFLDKKIICKIIKRFLLQFVDLKAFASFLYKDFLNNPQIMLSCINYRK